MTTREDDPAGTASQIFDVYEPDEDDDGYGRGTVFVAALGVAVVAAIVLAALEMGNQWVAALVLAGTVSIVVAVETGAIDGPF